MISRCNSWKYPRSARAKRRILLPLKAIGREELYKESISGCLHQLSNSPATASSRIFDTLVASENAPVRHSERGRLRSQFDGLDFGHKSAVVACQERVHDTEQGVAEAADVQDVVPFRSLGGRVRLEVDADQSCSWHPGPGCP
jgi:hypothetical protein